MLVVRREGGGLKKWPVVFSGFLTLWISGTIIGAEPQGARAPTVTIVVQDEDVRALDTQLGKIIEKYKTDMGGDTPEDTIPYYNGYFADMIESPCDYLDAAVKLIQVDHGADRNKEEILFTSMWSLPLRDYVTVWAPAVIHGFEQGYVNEHQLVKVIFPPHPWRGDFALAYQEAPIRDFYTMVLRKKKIAAISTRAGSVGEGIEKILNGEIASTLRLNLERGLIDPIKRVDLKTSCAGMKKGDIH
jgi:hypothetical protein